MTGISVVIPVLDDAELLERCLSSLELQSRPADEVIVVDNGCTDDSVAVATRFGARIVTEPRRGITAAASAGFDAATGDIIARCDADSHLPEDWIEHLATTLDRHSDAVAVSGPASFYNLSPVASAVASRIYVDGWFLLMRGLLGNNAVFGSNCAVRASAWRAISSSVPRTNSEMHDDMDLSYRLRPDATVLHDRRMRVSISGRPFDSMSVFRLRLDRAWNTFSLHLPGQLPIARWVIRARSSRHDSRVPVSLHQPLRKARTMNSITTTDHPIDTRHTPADERSFLSRLLGVFAVIIFSVIAVVFTIGWALVTLIGRAVRRLRPRASRRPTGTRREETRDTDDAGSFAGGVR
jgi:glycosyltransferase involved in cell wall biosynthesis